jgi:hypothetical protein
LKKKIRGREEFFGRMEAAVPWAELLAVGWPFYPKATRTSKTSSN